MGSYGIIEEYDESTFGFLFVAGVLIHLCEDIVDVELQASRSLNICSRGPGASSSDRL
jgi:hypothetical protein